MFSVENSGLRYRLSEDHLVKEIPFSQITLVKIKTNYPFMPFFLAISCFISAGIIFRIKQVFTLEVHKGPLIAEVFITESKKESQYIKTQIKQNLSQ